MASSLFVLRGRGQGGAGRASIRSPPPLLPPRRSTTNPQHTRCNTRHIIIIHMDNISNFIISRRRRRWYWSLVRRVRRAVPSPRSRALVSRRGAPLRPTPATRRHEHLLHSARRRSAWPRCPLPLLPRARPSHRRPVNQRPPKTSPLTPWPAPCRSARSPKRTKRVGGASGPRPCRREPHTTKTGRPAKSATELRHQTRHIEPGEVPEGPKPLGAHRGTLSTAPVSRGRLQLDGANLAEVARRV